MVSKRTLLEAPGQRVLVINLGTVLIEMTRGVIDEDWLNLYSWEGMVVVSWITVVCSSIIKVI